eukprot:m.458152 g.458152  ORF g.458152 m.458152 type:complete len:464 (+) comp21434_c0_seq1:504-1895(+)
MGVELRRSLCLQLVGWGALVWGARGCCPAASIHIFASGGQILNLDEVRVFDCGGTEVTPTNATLSTSIGFCTAGKCIDGRRNGGDQCSQNTNSMCHTDHNDLAPELRVFLPSPSVSVSRVQVINRLDPTFQGRIVGFRIGLFTAASTAAAPTQTFVSNRLEYNFSFSCTAPPSASPTTAVPTVGRTAVPSHAPTLSPTLVPSRVPTAVPTATPTLPPSERPSSRPTTAPSHAPSIPPTDRPTASPTSTPTAAPTATVEAPANSGGGGLGITVLVVVVATLLLLLVAVIVAVRARRRKQPAPTPTAPPAMQFVNPSFAAPATRGGGSRTTPAAPRHERSGVDGGGYLIVSGGAQHYSIPLEGASAGGNASAVLDDQMYVAPSGTPHRYDQFQGAPGEGAAAPEADSTAIPGNAYAEPAPAQVIYALSSAGPASAGVGDYNVVSELRAGAQGVAGGNNAVEDTSI